MATQAGVVDLGKLEIDGFMSRIQAQSAWLIGPLRNAPVPIGCFRAHIVADRAIFHEYAAQNGFEDTNSLFPSLEGDPILNALLGLPWREIKGVRNDGFSIPAFRRSLELPEYSESFVKIAWPRTAFFRGERIAEKFGSIDGDPLGGIVVSVPEISLFGSADKNTPMRFPQIEALVQENGTVCIRSRRIDPARKHGRNDALPKGGWCAPKRTRSIRGMRVDGRTSWTRHDRRWFQQRLVLSSQCRRVLDSREPSGRVRLWK